MFMIFIFFDRTINIGYDSEDVIFTGWLYKINTLEINEENRSQNGRSADFRQDIIEYIGNNCYIRASGKCFKKCPNYSTGKDYTEAFLTFIRLEQRRLNVMTTARIQPFCRKENNNIACYDGFRVCPRNKRDRKKGNYVHKNRFCLIWKSDAISSNKAIEV